jgi:hypothetical protein
MGSWCAALTLSSRDIAVATLGRAVRFRRRLRFQKVSHRISIQRHCSRAGLNLKTRELGVIAALTALGNAKIFFARSTLRLHLFLSDWPIAKRLFDASNVTELFKSRARSKLRGPGGSIGLQKRGRSTTAVAALSPPRPAGRTRIPGDMQANQWTKQNPGTKIPTYARKINCHSSLE